MVLIKFAAIEVGLDSAGANNVIGRRSQLPLS